jgi:hypothetical protein
MRNTYIGLGAAAAIILVIFIISRLMPHPQVAQQQAAPAGPSPQEVAAAAAQVGAGFNGDVQIGKWSLKCAPEAAPKPAPAAPQSTDGATTLNADGSAVAPAAAPAKKPAGLELGRCRASLLVRPRNNPKIVSLVAVVRLIKDPGKDRVALILHVPPVNKVGAKLLVALTEKEVVGLPVLNCDKGQCVALGVLEQQVYQTLTARPGVAVVVPIQAGGKANGQRMVIPLSMQGLSDTIGAMKRAG